MYRNLFLVNISSVSYCFECKNGGRRDIKQMVGSHYFSKFKVCNCGDFCRISYYRPSARVPGYPPAEIHTYPVHQKGYFENTTFKFGYPRLTLKEGPKSNPATPKDSQLMISYRLIYHPKPLGSI